MPGGSTPSRVAALSLSGGWLAQEDLFAPPTTGGAQRAVAAAAERMRANPFPGTAVDSDPAPAPPAAAAPPAESPSDAETPDGGSTPPATPEAPAQDAPDQKPRYRLVNEAQKPDAPADAPTPEETSEAEASAYAKLLTRYGNDPEKLAEAFHGTEQRAVSMAKELKELKEGGAPPSPAGSPAPATTPDTAAATPVPADAEIDDAVRADAETWFQQDPQMRQWRQSHAVTMDRLGKILTDNGGQVSGELAEVSRDITRLEGLLDTRASGLDGVVSLDDDQREQIERRLELKRGRSERLKIEYENLLTTKERLERAWDARWTQTVESIRQKHRATAGQAKAAAALEAERAAAEDEWNAEVARVTEKLSPADKAEATRRLEQALRAEAQGLDEFGEFGSFVDAQMKIIRADWDRRSGAEARAIAKRREEINRQPAPPIPAATAKREEPPPTVDKRAARRAAELRAGSLARTARVVPIANVR